MDACVTSNQPEESTMDFDDILDELGEFGPYQITVYSMLCLPVFFGAANFVSYVFTAAVPNYRCFVPGCDDLKGPSYFEPWATEAIPFLQPNTGFYPTKCSMYIPQQNYTGIHQCPIGHFSDVAIECDAWVFDEEKTIVNEWNITCPNNLWKLYMVGTAQFAGILLGLMVFGFLADKYGRKNVLVSCIMIMGLSGTAQVFSSSYFEFMMFGFINAFGNSVVFQLAFVLGVELVGRKKRVMSGIVLHYFFAAGEAAVALVAWYTKDWVKIQLAVSAPCLVFVIYYWTLPESVRWLLANGKYLSARKIVIAAAKRNKVELSPKLMNKVQILCKLFEEEGSSNMDKKCLSTGECLREIIKSRSLCLRSFSLYFNWAANGIIYYGLSINSTNLGGNKYICFALVALIEIPGNMLSWYLMQRYGRRCAMFSSLLLCSVMCLSAALVPEGMWGRWYVETALVLIAKLGITSSFGILYIFTAELYPTIMRSAGVGAGLTASMGFSMLAPFTPYLGQYSKDLPLYLFGGIAFIVALLTLQYPETQGKKLPETMDDIEQL